MIEQYFENGFTYDWNAPRPVETGRTDMDGSIVLSGSSHPPQLRFSGYYPKLFAAGAPAPTTTLAIGTPIRHRWLDYVVGRTAYVRSTNTDVLTGFMSGCWICSWVSRHGNRRVGHIGTTSIAADNLPPNTTVKEFFLTSEAMDRGSHIRGYNPAQAVPFHEQRQFLNDPSRYIQIPHIMSLVTTNNEFYSIIMLQTKTPGKWICGGKRRVHSSDRRGIQTALA